MRVHHLNAATMCPWGGRLIAGRGGLLARARMVCHVLLIETSDGLVLVDTGLGTGDIARPRRLGAGFVALTQPRLDRAETALAQIEALGFAAADVRHIVLTHMDLDHAGGLGDFPRAKVHLHLREHEAAQARKTLAAKARYIPAQWAHGPDWVPHGDGGGEDWFGFAGVRALGFPEGEILLVPLHGHTAGHCGVALRTPEGWILHAGDAYFHHGSLAEKVATPPGLVLFQAATDTIGALRKKNQERLRQLKLARGREITIFCAHDPAEFDACCAGHRL
ncbi:MBL fold metallo-hydrolase [Zavarzinia compransoris]|uniref:MBL fold metallo-hydrolase n=1 Tax=Zavarzinia compransoris TaxID=1264899 RepID=A0A317ECD4_9PROT|nr:MBL fold metallo-hydrolase [Zavarzinia compransoris]PWR23926.1 MBL fold metallo-hydrolase [Zavarzinia compransoris]TDP48171.1 glyoxylase-like metal-dependent hydrolase (beta-lactamase superfamily II) [Zavarzinia compransoris]